MNREFNNNDREFDRKIYIANKRSAIVSVIWCSLLLPIIFFIPDDNFNTFISVFIYCWMLWAIVGILLLPKIIRKIWKN